MGIFVLNKPIEEAKPTVDENAVIEDKDEKDDIQIVLNGSLSSIYTEALNKVYAIESTDSTSTIVIEKEEEERPKLFVQTYSDDDLEGDMVAIGDKLSIALSTSSGKILVSLESDKSIRAKVFIGYLKEKLGIDTTVGLEDTMKAIIAMKGSS